MLHKLVSLYLITLFILQFSSPLFAQTGEEKLAQLLRRADELGLSQKKQWIDLLHIRPNILGIERSQVKGSEFFLARDGYKDPNSELKMTLQSLLTREKFKDNEHPLCRFPARRFWLAKNLQIKDSEFPAVSCPLYDFYLRNINAGSISVVFSSYYPNNPASLFGHTFYRINRKLSTNEKPNELLDHGMGYAAIPTTINPLLYTLLGLFGGFKAVYDNVPYYFKVREYNDSESRSLWSYDLNLTEEEVFMVVNHLWEVGGSHFDYYFLTQNCGFHLLTVLEAAVPRISVVESIPFYVVPAETLKALQREKSLIKEVTFRPSAEQKFFQKWNQLSDQNRILARQYIGSKNIKAISDSNMNKEEQALLLDTLVDHFDYKNPKIVFENPNSSLLEERNRLLEMRSKIDVISPPSQVPTPQSDRPDQGHPGRRFGLSLGNDHSLLQFRFSLHDFLDPEKGYPKSSTIELMNLKLRKNLASLPPIKRAEWELEDLTLVKVMSLFPMDEFHRSPSWNFQIFSKNIIDHRCFHCLGSGIEGGYGVSLNPLGNGRFITFGFLNGGIIYSDQFTPSHLSLSLGPLFGGLLKFNDSHLLMTFEQKFFLERLKEGRNKDLPTQFNRFFTEWRYHFNSNWAGGVSFSLDTLNKNHGANLYYYF